MAVYYINFFIINLLTCCFINIFGLGRLITTDRQQDYFFALNRIIHLMAGAAGPATNVPRMTGYAP